MKIYSFLLNDPQNVTYLGKDMSSLLDSTLVNSRRFIKYIDIREYGNKIKIVMHFTTSPNHKFTFEFNVKSFKDVYFSLEIGSKSIRVSNRMRKFDALTIENYFRLLDNVFLTIFRKVLDSTVIIENNKKFVSVIDKVNTLILY